MPLISARWIVFWIASVVLTIFLLAYMYGASCATKKDTIKEECLKQLWMAGGLKYLVATWIVVLVTIGLHWLIKHVNSEEDNRGLWAIVIGQDRRVSTSKLQVALWTYAVFFSLLLLLFFPPGLKKFTENGLQEEYLVLLGSPAAAAVLAKTFTTTQVANGTTPKPEANKDPGLVDGAAQAISNDEGRTDLFDFQYLLFNVVALLYFFWTFLPDPREGIPPLPLTLVALTGVAAAGYTTKKGLPTNAPVLTGIYPATAAPGDEILIRGKNLSVSSGAKQSFRVTGENLTQERTEQGDFRISGNNLVIEDSTGSSSKVSVRFGGKHEQMVSLAEFQPAATDEIKVSVPADAEPGNQAPVMVIRADGIATEELPFGVITREPTITSVYPPEIDLDQHDKIIINGIGFRERAGQDQTSNNRVMLDQVELDINRWNPRQIRAQLPTTQQLMDGRSTMPDSVELVVWDRDSWMSPPYTVPLRG